MVARANILLSHDEYTNGIFTILNIFSIFVISLQLDVYSRYSEAYGSLIICLVSRLTNDNEYLYIY